MSNAAMSHDGSRIEPSLTPPASPQGGGSGAAAAPAAAPPIRRLYGPLVVGIVALVIGAVSVFVWMRTPGLRHAPAEAPQTTAPAPATTPAVAPTGVPGIHNPIPEVAPAEGPPLPVLAASDGPLAEALAALFGHTTLERYLMPEEVIRRIVATVDNLPRKTYAQRLSPVKPVPGAYAAGKLGERLVVPPAQHRYAPYVDALTAVDAKRLVALYMHWYPLFQEAYRDLGYPQGYFNDRLVEVLDLLIATPERTEPLALAQPKVLYEFADPALEALPSGQKLLLRMGPDNARRVKAKLVEIRKLVAAQKP